MHEIVHPHVHKIKEVLVNQILQDMIHLIMEQVYSQLYEKNVQMAHLEHSKIEEKVLEQMKLKGETNESK